MFLCTKASTSVCNLQFLFSVHITAVPLQMNQDNDADWKSVYNYFIKVCDNGFFRRNNIILYDVHRVRYIW